MSDRWWLTVLVEALALLPVKDCTARYLGCGRACGQADGQARGEAGKQAGGQAGR